MLATGYGLARHFSFNFPAWKNFFNQPFFQGGKKKFKATKHLKHVLRHTLNFIFEATPKATSKRNRTGKYAAALSQYMRIGMPAAKMSRGGRLPRLLIPGRSPSTSETTDERSPVRGSSE